MTRASNPGRFHEKSLVDSADPRGGISMAASAKAVLGQALKLPPNDRAALVENLIRSLDKPDPSLDAQWLKEAEDRLAAYRSGELTAVDAEQVFAELGRRV
jgi:putative addiction module component (TIGR02574 family)